MAAFRCEGRGTGSGARNRERRSEFPIVRTVRTTSQGRRKLVVESVAFGLGYTAVLICLVA